MSSSFSKYIDALLASQTSVSSLEDALRIVKSSSELVDTLDNPNITPAEKEKVVDDLFAPSVKKVIFDLSKDCRIDALEDIVTEYIHVLDKQSNVADAVIYCVTPPDEKQLEGIKEFICKEENASKANVEIVEDKELIGGFIVRVSGREYDFSLKSKLDKIKSQVMKTARESNVDSGNVIAVLKQDIKDFEYRTDGEQIGTVVRVGDSIATIHGLDHAMYGEIVVFENGVKGMVKDIKKKKRMSCNVICKE